MTSYVETESGYQYPAVPYIPPAPVIASGLVAGNTSLDGGGDGMHLLLHGTLASGDSYIQCQDSSSTTKFKIDHDGKIQAPDLALPQYDLVSELTAMQHATSTNGGYITQVVTLTNENTTKLDQATAASTQNTIVKRAPDGSQTHIKKAEVEQLRILSALPNVSLYGQGAFQFIPLDTNGNPVTTAEYSYGKRISLLGDPSSAGDGLFFQRDNNEVAIEVSQSSPTLRIRV